MQNFTISYIPGENCKPGLNFMPKNTSREAENGGRRGDHLHKVV